MLQGILLVFLVIVAIAMMGVILLQRSEGGALGTGGGPSGFLTTRGAGDLLTRTTAILATVFFALCIVLTVVNGRLHHSESVVDRLKIDPLAPDALAPKTPAAPATSQGGALAPASPFSAPAPEVHTAPASQPATTLQTAPAPATPAKP